MIETGQGDLLKSSAEALVNTVNCVGNMGGGLALQFKRAFPANYQAYRKACHADMVVVGRMFITETMDVLGKKTIINFPTKKHWMYTSQMAYIEVGLQDLVCEVLKRKIRSIAIPALGCGLGGLDWSKVKPMIVDAFKDLPDVRVELYEPA